MTSTARTRPAAASSSAHDNVGIATMKCPTCNFVHRARTDVFGNRITVGGGGDDPSSPHQLGGGDDYDAREVYGITATCPICIEECTDVVALRCGHVLCKSDYRRMGGLVRAVLERSGTRGNDDDDDGILVHIQYAGQGGVNGTYRRHRDRGNTSMGGGGGGGGCGGGGGRYTSMGRYNGTDVEYYMEVRVVDGGARMWYLSCHTGNPSEPPVDFYRANVNECTYPYGVRWEAATLFGTFPPPRSAISHFE